jgi:hypothetical protein
MAKKFVRKNVYLCNACGGGWVSADLDIGVTPFMDQCPLCGRLEGRSLFYNVPQPILADIPARVEWYKPTHAEKAGLTNMMLSHVQNGGLVRRLVPVKVRLGTLKQRTMDKWTK